MKPLLFDVHLVQKLSDTLKKSPKVSKHDTKDEPQAWTIAVSLKDIESSSRKIYEELIPELVNRDLSPEAIEDVLHQIGEELRHILYHIRDCKYYDYIP